MSSRSNLTILIGAFSILGFSACKTVYSDTFSYRKNSFKAPVEKAPKIEAPAIPNLPDTTGGGLIPTAPGGMPGGMPGGLPEGGAIPGIPGAEPAPGVPAVPPVPPAVPGL